MRNVNQVIQYKGCIRSKQSKQGNTVAYQTIPKILPNSQFRQYKLRKNERWFVLNKKIRTSQQLLEYINKINPTDVYQSVSYWLNPTRLGSKKFNAPTYKGDKTIIKEAHSNYFLSSIFLGSDYIMDFDDKDYKNGQEDSRSNLELAKLKLQEIGFKEFLTMRTGRGYQLLVMDFNEWAKKDMKAVMPRDREDFYLVKMRKLTRMLLASKIRWDYRVSVDTRRIFRVPNSVHNNGNIIKVLT